MSHKSKPFAASPKSTRRKISSTVSVASSSRAAVVKAPEAKTKINPKTISESSSVSDVTALYDDDTTLLQLDSDEPDFNQENMDIAYSLFLHSMLEECIIDEKIERVETEMDLQITQLAERFQKTMLQLDKTNKRLKDISFVVEQKRLLDLKCADTTKIFDAIDNSNAQELVQNLNTAETDRLDFLVTKNVDFGYDKESGHKQLLDAVTEALDGLNEIKKHSNLNTEKFEEYKKAHENIDKLEEEKIELESLKMDFEKRFPKFNEKLLKEASRKIAKMMNDDNE